MGTMRGHGMGMSSSAERSPRGGSARLRANADLPKRKPNLKKLWPEIKALIAPRKGLLAGGMALMAVNRVAGLVLPYTSKTLLDKVLSPTNPHPELLGKIIALVFSAMIVQAITSFSLTQLLSKAGQRLIAEMRRQVQKHVGLLSVAYYDENRTGTLVARIMSDVEGVRNLVGTGLVEFVGGLLTAVLAFVFLLHRSATVTLTVFAVVGLFVFVLQYAFKKIRPIFRERAKINSEVTGRLTESLGGVRVIKGYHAEEREASVFALGVERLLNNVMKSLTLTSVLGSASTTVLGLVSALVMWLGGHAVLNHTWTVGDYFSYNMFLAIMVMPIFQIVNIGTQLTEAFAGLDRTREIMSELEENQDPKRKLSMPPIEGNVRFENVEFAYETDKPVLHGISFEAQPGTVTALVGSSGSGKSTVISLVCAFHTPTSGQVLVDGIDLATVNLNTYRSQLGVVLQDSFLFDGSIRENILFSRPEATEEQFLFACRTARVDEFAERFPEGYDTIVGERGVKLSGGQRQRLSIARALLAQPRILILDEATSSLDSESEAMIQAGLNQLMVGRTTFVIAHRLSTIRRADQILVVEQGRIVERGNHAALFALGGRYYDLYTRQHGLEENLFLAPGEGDEVPA
ncbi:ABC transporter ATP-binding protein [Occallatibacter savannae]|uniref:ABC transporter ATP-binding protein n=1 Tax=Occallatibacter savannae TaxID=1002691 RepID=UPI001EF5D0D7|nr:ABC transporter ATP-binding protein [Occallatibacter savannae]